MNSIYYDLQEIFFLVFSPCWTMLLALFVAGAILLAAQRVLSAIWRQRRGVYIVSDDHID